MKDVLGGISFAILIFLALIVQEFIPPVHMLLGAHVLLVPALFCLAAIAYSAWTMLSLAVFTGFIADLMNLHIVGGRVEIALGWSIVYFVLLGLLCHGFQPAFMRGGWWIHTCLAVGGTSLYLALQYVMICFRREGVVLNEMVFWRIIGPGLIAAAFAPLVYLAWESLRHLIPGEYPRGDRFGGRA